MRLVANLLTARCASTTLSSSAELLRYSKSNNNRMVSEFQHTPAAPEMCHAALFKQAWNEHTIIHLDV